MRFKKRGGKVEIRHKQEKPREESLEDEQRRVAAAREALEHSERERAAIEHAERERAEAAEFDNRPTPAPPRWADLPKLSDPLPEAEAPPPMLQASAADPIPRVAPAEQWHMMRDLVLQGLCSVSAASFVQLNDPGFATSRMRALEGLAAGAATRLYGAPPADARAAPIERWRSTYIHVLVGLCGVSAAQWHPNASQAEREQRMLMLEAVASESATTLHGAPV